MAINVHVVARGQLSPRTGPNKTLCQPCTGGEHIVPGGVGENTLCGVGGVDLVPGNESGTCAGYLCQDLDKVKPICSFLQHVC